MSEVNREAMLSLARGSKSAPPNVPESYAKVGPGDGAESMTQGELMQDIRSRADIEREIARELNARGWHDGATGRLRPIEDHPLARMEAARRELNDVPMGGDHAGLA